MIEPPAPTPGLGPSSRWKGVAFSERSDGDVRGDAASRADLARRLGISEQWATLTQIHGSRVVQVDRPGDQGRADAMFTSRAGLPLAIFTADCAGVVVHAPGAVGVAHAGWRGAAGGVVAALILEMRRAGFEPALAAIGPTVGPCCLEVGPEVSALFDGFTATTTWGTASIDLEEAVKAQLAGLETWLVGKCTRHDPGWFSHRRDRTKERMATIAWMETQD
jgi:purine-nucleoside/S-methyl-5'-thioadenosine phosphorylase / adenosine deaminase